MNIAEHHNAFHCFSYELSNPRQVRAYSYGGVESINLNLSYCSMTWLFWSIKCYMVHGTDDPKIRETAMLFYKFHRFE